MNKLAVTLRIAACAASLAIAGATTSKAAATASKPTAATTPATTDSQASLTAYGRWMSSVHYGRVWKPTIATESWHPYYDGHWQATDVGQTWVSDYPWGNVTFHYGTWAVEPGRGWIWIPGDVWAPSWVVFRTGTDAIGWAPVAPGFVVGGASAASAGGFVFVPGKQFFASRIRGCTLPPSRTAALVSSSTVVDRSLRVENHVVVNRGPSLDTLRHATGRPVRMVRLESVQGMGSSIRRTIRMDEARARGEIRVCEQVGRSATATQGTRGSLRGATAYDAPDSAAGTGASSDRTASAVKTAYDGFDSPQPGRAVHQDIVGVSAGAARAAHEEARAPGGETQSDRDVMLLASRERTDRARARTGSAGHRKSRS